MSEIKRYDIDWSALYRYDRYPVEDPEGEWVRWEDVEAIIKEASKRDNNPPAWYYGTPLPPTDG